MKSISLYQARHTFVHTRVDAFTKLLYLFCSIVASFAVPTLSGATAIFLVNIVILAFAKELGRALKTILGSLLLLVTVFVIQGLFNPNNHTEVFQIGGIHIYREGLLFAISLGLRVVNIISASCVLVMTASPQTVMESCVRRGLPAKAGYVVVSILQMIPAMLQRVATIREAQQSRGLSLEGNVIARFRTFLPILGPVVLSSLMTIQDKAMALEVRGFTVKGEKTFYQEEPHLTGMTALRIVVILATLLVLTWRFVH